MFVVFYRGIAINKFCNQKGVGLIEVMVSFVILAIGLLGVLSMQARGFSSSQRALFSTEVNLLASDMADRIMAFGLSGASSGEYHGVSTRVDFKGNIVAANGRDDWDVAMSNSILPSAVGDVRWIPNNATGGGTYTISIRWDEYRQGLLVGTLAADCAGVDKTTNGSGETLSCFQLQVTL